LGGIDIDRANNNVWIILCFTKKLTFPEKVYFVFEPATSLGCQKAGRIRQEELGGRKEAQLLVQSRSSRRMGSWQVTLALSLFFLFHFVPSMKLY
jgi:hypothetical protein